MRWRLSVWFVSLVGVGIVFSMPAAASAETGDYPYHAKPCVHAPYAVHSAKAHWCHNYDWGDRRNDTSQSNVISPYGYYYRNCTDYAAWKVATLGVQPAQYKGLGDAKRWATPPIQNGLRVDSVPTVGSVAVRTTGTYGHVAFVESVGPTGDITVSEYNKRADGAFSRRSGTPADLGFTHFVHFEAYMPAPPVAVPPAPLPPVVPVQSEAPALPVTVTEAPVPHEVPAPEGNEQLVAIDSDLPPATTDTQQANASAQPEAAHRGMVGGLAMTAQERDLPDKAVPAGESDQVLAFESLDALVETAASNEPASLPDTTFSPEAEPQDEPLPVVSSDEVPATNIPPIIATALPVPHQWWREAVVPPPSSHADSAQQVTAFAQQFVSPFGYWALGGLIAAVVLREYCLLAASMSNWRWALRL